MNGKKKILLPFSPFTWGLDICHQASDIIKAGALFTAGTGEYFLS